MTSAKEKILEMVAAGKVTPAEGEALIAALAPSPRRLWGWLADPFTRMPTALGLAAAIVIAGLGVVVSVAAGVRFDGALDLHGAPATLAQALVDQLLGWGLLALLFWGTVRLVARQGRLLDWLWVMGVARAPLVVAALVVAAVVGGDRDPAAVAQNPFQPRMALLLLTVPLLVWFVVLLYRGARTVAGLSGGRMVTVFVGVLVGAEILSKLGLVGVGLVQDAAVREGPALTLAAPPTSAPESRADEFVALLGAGQYREAHARFSEEMAAALSESGLAWTWRLTELQVGALRGVVGRQVDRKDALTVVDLTCGFTRGQLRVRVVFNDRDQVTGFWLKDIRS